MSTTISCRFFAPAAIVLAVFSGAAPAAQTAPQVPPPRPFPLPPATQPSDPSQPPRRDGQPLAQTVPAAERWSTTIGASTFIPPVMTETHVFAAVPPASIAAFRLEDGAEAWRVDLAAEHPLALDEGRLFLAAGEAVHCLDARTGAVVWRQPTGALSVPPLVHGGWVLTATGAEVVARRATDGAVVWQAALGPLARRPTIEGDALYLPLADSRVKSVALTSGALNWERALGGAPSEIAALAGRVYVGSSDKYFYCLDAGDGETEWRRRVGAALVGRPAIDAGRVYVAAMDNLLRALDRVSGALKWQVGLPFRPSAGPILFGTAVIVPGVTSELPTFDVKTGKAGRPIAFGAPLAAALDLRLTAKGPIAATVTGDLSVAWKLTLWEPAMTIPVAPLSELPGTAIPLQAAPPPGGGP